MMNPFAALGEGGGDMMAMMQSMMNGGGRSMEKAFGNMFQPSEEMIELLSTIENRPKIVYGPGVSPQTPTDKWKIVYPHYIDATRSMRQGRRVRKDYCVNAPTPSELGEAATSVGYRWVLEDKCYPRDALLRGRLRIEIGPEIKKEKALQSLAEHLSAIRVQRAESAPGTKAEAKSASSEKGSKKKGRKKG